MLFSTLDIVIFVAFVAIVVAVGLYKSRGEGGSEDYFLAGRGLSWWLIGFSLIAANISTEQFVGMSGSAAGPTGLAIASYEWMAAITLVFVAFFFLPKFLKSGIYTMPQFLEYRFDSFSRTVMSLLMVIMLVGVNVTGVIYSGALTASIMFEGHSIFGIPMDLTFFAWTIGIVAAIYVFAGGLKACAWADLIQGAALIAGGAIIAYLALDAIGAIEISKLATTSAAETIKNVPENATAIEKFAAVNSEKLSMFLPNDNPEVPWTALIIGLWISNFYYWSLNQYIMQRTLGASSLAEGQRGIMFAAFMKLLIPFFIVFPGLIAFNLYSEKMANAAFSDQKIVNSNAENYATVYIASQNGKVSAQELLSEILNDSGEVKPSLKLEDADALIKKYNEESASKKLENVRFRYDTSYANKYPERVKLIDIWNKKADELNSNFDSLSSQLLGESQTRRLVGYKYDTAFAYLLKDLVPANGLTGFIFAALLGAVISSLASMLNAASTIFTIDIFKRFLRKNADDASQVRTGRTCVVIFTIVGCLVAPFLNNPMFTNIFTYIQEFQGFLSPGILAVFLFGLFSKRAPRFAGAVGIIASPVIYGTLKLALPDVAFLNRMAATFVLILIIMEILTLVKPLANDIKMPESKKFADTRTLASVKIMGTLVLVIAISFYIIFR